LGTRNCIKWETNRRKWNNCGSNQHPNNQSTRVVARRRNSNPRTKGLYDAICTTLVRSNNSPNIFDLWEWKNGKISGVQSN
jgi:hypothetical protein